MSVYVFLGPSLPVDRARVILDATYLPPAKAGDVYALVANRPRAIAIIDGLFEQVPAVWHKEILYALAHGVRVFGASSMGALRAAELHPFGMEGVGQVFDAFASGALEDDDEVTVVHGDASFGHRALSEAMVNIREGLSRAASRGTISAASHATLLAAAKRAHYPDRSWPAVRELGLELGVPRQELDALLVEVRREPPDVKGRDAIALLQRLRSLEPVPVRTPRSLAFDFEPTIFFRELVASVQEGAGRGAVAGAAERFRRARGLLSARDTHAWLAERGLSATEFSAMIEIVALAEQALSAPSPRVDRELVERLRASGGLSPQSERASAPVSPVAERPAGRAASSQFPSNPVELS